MLDPALPVLGRIDCESSEQDDWYCRMSRNTFENSGKYGFSLDTSGARGVVADHPVSDVNDVRLRHARALIHARVVPKPPCQSRLPAIKLMEGVMPGKGSGPTIKRPDVRLPPMLRSMPLQRDS